MTKCNPTAPDGRIGVPFALATTIFFMCIAMFIGHGIKKTEIVEVETRVPVYVDKVVYLPGPPSDDAVMATFREIHKMEWMLGFIANLIAQKETADECQVVQPTPPPVAPIEPKCEPVTKWRAPGVRKRCQK